MRACCYRQWHSRDFYCFVGSVDELIEDRWSGHGGMGMVAPRAIQVYHSFLSQGSPHCMVVVKMWPYSGKRKKWRRVMCMWFFFCCCCCCSLLDCSPPILMPYWWCFPGLLADVVRHCAQVLICYMSRVCHALALLGDVTILEPCSIFMLRYPSRLGLYWRCVVGLLVFVWVL